MKKTNYTPILTMVLTLVLTACSSLGQGAGASPLTASGTIEANTVNLASEIGGKIVEMKVDQGNSVQAGDEIFKLDDSALQAQRSQAQAVVQAAQSALAAAQANLDLLKAGATSLQLNAAQAQLDQAEANRLAIQATLDSVTAGNRPEEIAAAQARLEWAQHVYNNLTVVLDATQVEDVHTPMTQAQSNLDQAKARLTQLQKDTRTPPSALDASSQAINDVQTLLDAATLAYTVVQDATMPFYQQIAAVQKTWELAQLTLSQANARQSVLKADANMTQVALNTAQSTIDDAQMMVDKTNAAYTALKSSDQATLLASAWTEVQNAQTNLNALGKNNAGTPTLENLLNQLNAATAARDVAQANLANLKNGARLEQVAAAQAQVDEAKAQMDAAQAALALINVQIGKMTVTAPIAGVVLNLPFNAGEIVPAGATVVEIGTLDQVALTVFVPEDQYGLIKLGQKAAIKVDSYPGKSFEGTVEFISDQAEFTPRNVQTAGSRSTTVYAIKIGIPNPDHSLKPGMPADGAF